MATDVKVSEELIQWGRDAKFFMNEAAETDDLLPTDDQIMRAAVSYSMLLRREMLVPPKDDMERSHAIALIAHSYSDYPGNTPQRAKLFWAQLDKARAELTLPARHARVNAMGHSTYLGPVTPLPRGGYRVEHHEFDEADERGPASVITRWVDVFALHSVEWLSADEWAKELGELNAIAERSNERWRRMEMPEGYAPITKAEVEGDVFGFRDPTGHEHWLYNGTMRSEARARAGAWSHFDEGPEPAESDIPSDATAEAPAANQGERLNLVTVIEFDEVGAEVKRTCTTEGELAELLSKDVIGCDLDDARAFAEELLAKEVLRFEGDGPLRLVRGCTDKAVSLTGERDGHNFAPTLTAVEAGGLIDALLELLPRWRRHVEMPEGYAPITKAEGDVFGFRDPTGHEHWLYNGTMRSEARARAGAWSHFDEGAPAAESSERLVRDLESGDLAEDPKTPRGLRWVFRIGDRWSWVHGAGDTLFDPAIGGPNELGDWDSISGSGHTSVLVRRRGLKTLDEVRDALDQIEFDAEVDAEMRACSICGLDSGDGQPHAQCENTQRELAATEHGEGAADA